MVCAVAVTLNGRTGFDASCAHTRNLRDQLMVENSLRLTRAANNHRNRYGASTGEKRSGGVADGRFSFARARNKHEWKHHADLVLLYGLTVKS